MSFSGPPQLRWWRYTRARDFRIMQLPVMTRLRTDRESAFLWGDRTNATNTKLLF